MLGEVVRLVGNSGGALDLELSLADTIVDLPEAHIHSLGALGFDSIVGDSGGSGGVVFTLDSGGGLRASPFLRE